LTVRNGAADLRRRHGYGDKGNPPDINGTDTLVFVVDIIAAS